MATFTGLETVNNIVRLSTTSTGTLYTVPANTYSRVHIEYVQMGASASFQIGDAYVQTGGGGSAAISTMYEGAFGSPVMTISYKWDTVILYAGQVIAQSSANTVRITIIEYAIP